MVLEVGRVTDPRLEAWLVVVRRRVLALAVGETEEPRPSRLGPYACPTTVGTQNRRRTGRGLDALAEPGLLRFVASLALQCLRGGYIWPVTEAEEVSQAFPLLRDHRRG